MSQLRGEQKWQKNFERCCKEVFKNIYFVMEATLRKIGSLQPFSIPGVDALLNRCIL